MSTPLVSVIMLTCDRRELVGHMASDILGQTFRDLEFIIVDNGSSDGTAALVDGYARQDSRVKVTHLPKSGIGRGRNAGLALASGRYATFVDDDDRVDAGYLDFLLGLAEGGRHDMAVCGTDETVDGVRFTPQCTFEGQCRVGPEAAVRFLLERSRIRAGMPGKLARASLLRRHPFREDCIHEDIFTTYKYLSDVRSLVVSGTMAYHIVRHRGNCSPFTSDAARWTPSLMDEYLRAFRERTEFLSMRFPEMAAFVRYTEWSYMLSMLDKIATYGLTDCAELGRRMRGELAAHCRELAAAPWLKNFERDWLQRHVREG